VLSVDEEDSEIKPKYVMVCVNRRSCAERTSCAALGSINLADALGRIITARKIDVKFEHSILLHNVKKAQRFGLHRAGGLY
jgi:hypothetical protein